MVWAGFALWVETRDVTLFVWLTGSVIGVWNVTGSMILMGMPFFYFGKGIGKNDWIVNRLWAHGVVCS